MINITATKKMKRMIPLLLCLFLLAGCVGQANQSEDDLPQSGSAYEFGGIIDWPMKR